MEYTAIEKLYLFLDSFNFLTSLQKERLINVCTGKNFSVNFLNKKEELLSIIPLSKYEKILKNLNNEYIQQVVNNLNKNNVKAVCIESNNYPKSLLQSKIKPLIIYYKGNLSLLNRKGVLVIGSRKNTNYSIKLAELYSKEILNSGEVVISGIFDGVEEAIIKSNIDSKNIVCVSVGGLDSCYPSKNYNLLNEVAKNGLVISDMPFNSTVRKYDILRRNEILVELSKIGLIVSGAENSNLKSVATLLKSSNKKIYTFPYSLGIINGELCNRLLKEGANVVLEPNDILKEFNKNQKSTHQVVDELENRIIEIIEESDEGILGESIAEKLNQQIESILPKLTLLEIKNIIVKNVGNKYCSTGTVRRN